MSGLLRVYLDPADIGSDGYPYAWHRPSPPTVLLHEPQALPPIKDLIRELADHRCERCGHPYRKGKHGRGEWTPCDEHCTHGGPGRWRFAPEVRETDDWLRWDAAEDHWAGSDGLEVEARWRILTVHHLNGIKHDCRWWNLAALCQRCHLTIQGRVLMDRVYPLEHSEWFKPHAAGWYATAYLGEDLTRDETLGRLDELLALERIA